MVVLKNCLRGITIIGHRFYNSNELLSKALVKQLKLGQRLYIESICQNIVLKRIWEHRIEVIKFVDLSYTAGSNKLWNKTTNAGIIGHYNPLVTTYLLTPLILCVRQIPCFFENALKKLMSIF